MSFPPNINPELFSILGAVTGIIVEGDYTANELNSIGNWIILVGQFMLTTAAQQQLINGRYQNNNGSRIRSNANNHSANNKQYSTYEQLQELANYLKKLEEKIEEIIKKNFDLTPKGIIEYLGLREPIFTKTTNYGHFGKEDLEWEKIIEI